jgi:hypothetical protein
MSPYPTVVRVAIVKYIESMKCQSQLSPASLSS